MDVSRLRALSVGDATAYEFQGSNVQVDYADGKFAVKVQPIESDRMRQVLGARYHRQSDTWITPATRSQAVAISGVFDGRLDSTPAAKAHVAGLFQDDSLARDRAVPTPMWYSGPHAPTTTTPHSHMRVLLGGVPSVEPATDEVLSVLLADGTQYPGTEQEGRTQGPSEVRRLQERDVQRVREALREARSSSLSRMGLGSPAATSGDSASSERGQGRQPFGELGGDDSGRAHTGAPALFAFQQTDVGFLGHAGSVLLGSEMGVGKSILGAQFVWHHGGRALVIAPNSMKYKWKSELEFWAPGVDVVVIDGTAAKRRKQIAEAPDDVVFVINYEGLRTHTRLAPWGGKALTAKQKEEKDLNEFEWKCVVVDEAHKIKDPKAQQTMAVKQMGLQAEHRLAMTGTPLLNNPDDIWSIMNFVEPDEWGSRNQFRARYCKMQPAWHGHGQDNQGLRPEHREEFDKFFLPRFIRRTKLEVLPDLPEKATTNYMVIPLTSQQQKLYDTLVKDFMAIVDGELLIAENPLSLLIRLQQAACGMLEVDEKGEVTGIATPSNKLDALREIIAGSPGDPLVIFAESRKFIEMLQRELGERDGLRTGMVTGKQGAAQREKNVQHFQDGKLDLMLVTLGAGAEGITLTRSNMPILAQQSWSHGVNGQAIDRTHRIGQTRGVQPIVLISKGTIDEAKAVVDRTKELRLQELVRDPGWMEKAVRGQL